MTKNFLKIIFKSFYKIIPFKKFLFLLTKTIYDPPQTIYRHLAFKGVFSLPYKDKKIKIYHTGTFIENQIFWKGVDGYEPNSLKIWIELCKTSKTVSIRYLPQLLIPTRLCMLLSLWRGYTKY